MNTRFNEIYSIVLEMDYSSDNMLDLMSLIDEAIEIAKKDDSNRRTNHCLNNLIQTKQKEISRMLSKDIPEETRERYFNDAKNYFKTDLHIFCMKK